MNLLDDLCHLFEQPLPFIGVFLGGVILQQFVWAIIRLLFLPAVTHEHVGQIARSLAANIRTGRGLDTALYSLQSQMRWPLPWRLRRAAKALASESPPSLITALAQAKLLPREMVASGLAAEAAGLPSLLRWLDDRDAAGGLLRPVAAVLLPMISSLIACVVMIWFISVAITPKFIQIFRELGMPEGQQPGFFALPDLPGSPLALAIGITGVILWWRISRWRWKREAWYARGALLLTSALDRRAEPAIAEALAAGMPRQAEAYRRAGAAGDWPALTALAGWPARSPEELARRLDAILIRRRRRHLLAVHGLRIVLPLLLGLVVAWIGTGVFGALTTILYQVGDS